MATAADLIKSSLRKIGAIAAGEAPTAGEMADSLEALNDILEAWSNDGFMIFQKTIEEFTLTGGTGSYSIGTGATFDTVRPQIIEAVRFKQLGQTMEWLGRVYSAQEWSNISLKDLQSQVPVGVFYNPTYPNGTLHLWPVPSEAATVVLYSLKPLTALATGGTTLAFPPGYKNALKLELAIALAPEFGKTVDQLTVDAAREAKAGLARTNTSELLMVSDAFGLNECALYDINKGPV